MKPSISASQPAATSEEPPAGPDGVDAFVSYKRLSEDIAFVDDLQAQLAQRGKHIWLDRVGIAPAEDWRERIARAIETAKAVIFIVTPESVGSEECQRELAAAVQHHKLVIPVVRRDVQRDKLPDELTRPNWIFFRQGDDPEVALSDLVEALESDVDWRDEHARLAVRTREWAVAGKDRSFLLRGNDLRAAEEWATQAPAHPKTPPTALQMDYLLQSRKAADRAARTWRAALSAGLAVAVALGALAVVKEVQATREAHVAQSNAFAAEATVDLSTNPAQSLGLALRSARLDDSAAAEQALRLALAASRQRMVISSGDGPATVAAWDPSGGEVAVTAPGSVELWDTGTGRLLQALPVPAQFFDGEQKVGVSEVNQLTFDPGGSFLAAISSAGYVSVWRLGTDGKAVVVPTEVLNSRIRAGAWSRPPDPLLQVSAAWDVWRAPSKPGRWWPGGAEQLDIWGDMDNVLEFAPATGTVSPLFGTPSGRDVAAAQQVVPSPDGTEILVDGQIIDFAKDRQWELSLKQGDYSPTAPACWYPDGSTIVTSNSVSAGAPEDFWDAKTGRLTASMQTPDGPTTAVACSASTADLWAAAGDAAGNLLLRLANGSLVPLYGHSGAITGIASSRDGRYLATTSEDGTARIWDASSGRLVAVLAGDGSPLDEVQFDGDGGLALTVDSRGFLRIWDTFLGDPLAHLQSPPGEESLAIGFTGAGRNVYGIGYRLGAPPKVASMSLLLWEPGTGRLVARYALPGISPSPAACPGDLREVLGYPLLLSGSCRLPPPPGLATAVPVPLSSKFALDFAVGSFAVAVSPDGRYAAYGVRGSVVTQRLASRGRSLLAVPGGVRGLEFTNAGTLLVMSAKAVYVWHPFSHQSPRFFAIPSGVVDAELSQNGQRLATVDGGGTVSVWEVKAGRRLRTFRPQPAPSLAYFGAAPVRAALNTNGSVVAVGDTYGRAYLWDVASGHLIAQHLLAANWPIVELSSAGDGSRFIAVNFPQAGSGLNPPGTAEVLDAGSGQVLGEYSSPGPSLAPINPGVALSPDGSFLLSGDLGLSPSPPGGYQGVYQVDSGSAMTGLQDVRQSPLASYASSPAQPWSPDGTKIISANAIYVCDACGGLHSLQAEAVSRLAWAKALSAKDDRPPRTNPYG